MGVSGLFPGEVGVDEVALLVEAAAHPLGALPVVEFLAGAHRGGIALQVSANEDELRSPVLLPPHPVAGRGEPNVERLSEEQVLAVEGRAAQRLSVDRE